MYVRNFSGEELEQVASDSFMPVIARTGAGFRGRMTQQRLGAAVTLTRARSGPMRTIRTDRMAARASGSDLMTFCVHVSGRGYVHQHGRFAELTHGSAVLYEARSPWELASPADSQSLALQFSRDLLPLRSSKITESCARELSPASPAVGILAEYLDRLDGLADDLSGDQRIDAGQAAIDLLVMALRDVAPTVSIGDGSTKVLLEMLQAHVRDHFADALLTVEELARRHHMSVRHVYTLFELAETTPGAFIREQRLRVGASMLTDPRYDRLTVPKIAQAAGFLDPRTFERAFRRQYGMAPGGWRRQHRATESGPGLT
ncbi:helix-turn-helix domain-containing protein [Micromonospora sp. NPDC050397]|uniref:helix-turn-helix domain-containing protein n=1 Tax=Micromonospora sp. NPDC050397 TaxID=3364279 RepID=UPI00384F719F